MERSGEYRSKVKEIKDKNRPSKHDYEKLIKPSELLTYIDKGGLDFSEIKGMTYIPFFDIVKLSNDPSVNYIIHARKK